MRQHQFYVEPLDFDATPTLKIISGKQQQQDMLEWCAGYIMEIWFVFSSLKVVLDTLKNLCNECADFCIDKASRRVSYEKKLKSALLHCFQWPLRKVLFIKIHSDYK